MNKNMAKAVRECAYNGKRLLDEAQLLEFEKPPATLFFISLIAQEEFAKSFLLYLVDIEVIPWNSFILRATRDHKCKQLICIILDFLYSDTDKFIERINVAVLEGIPLDFPKKVADAINILRHEKIGRWESSTWFWAEDPEWDLEASKVAKGKIDREKQDSLYVRLGKNGSVVKTPKNIAESRAQEEYERGRRFEQFIGDLEQMKKPFERDFERVKNAFKMLFTEQNIG